MALSDYVDDPQIEVAVGLELAFEDPVRLWSGIYTLTFEGNEWTGTGSMMELGEVSETSNIEARGITLALSGVPVGLITLALGSEYQNVPATIWLWVITEHGADGEPIFRGFADVMNLREGNQANRIELSLESQLARLERAGVEIYSQEDLSRRHPGDRGLEFIEALQDKEFDWGGSGPRDVRGRTGR